MSKTNLTANKDNKNDDYQCVHVKEIIYAKKQKWGKNMLQPLLSKEFFMKINVYMWKKPHNM